MSEYDYGYQPRSYFVTDTDTVILSRIKGTVRQHIVRRIGPSNGDEYTRAESLTNQDRRAVSSYHPALMGGEYLPDLEIGEVEIARLELESTTADVLSLRARWVQGAISYRLVDEYERQFQLPISVSQEPLTFAEVITQIADLPRSFRDQNLEITGEIGDLQGFVDVSSEFYPELASYFHAEAAVWAREKRAELGYDDQDD